MNIDITAYPAKNGDCFLLRYRKEQQPQKYWLIDCGYADTIHKYVKEDLSVIGRKGGVLEKLILTHIDADHIQGAIKLLKENNREQFIAIKEIWFNTYRHLFNTQQTIADEKAKKILQQITDRGFQGNSNSENGDQQISAEQGTTVGALIIQGEYPWNTAFSGQAVSTDTRKEIEIAEHVKLRLLSPDNQKLEQLKVYWADELSKYGTNYDSGSPALYDDAFEMLLSWEKEKTKKRVGEIAAATATVEGLLQRPFEEDTTVTNGSSIAFVIQIEEKKLLFLGDAHPGLVVQSLRDYQDSGIIFFDLIKVSHHGSFANISKDLLATIDAPRYLISTNGGRHHHPDKETIAHIISRPAAFRREIYFNYATEHSKFFERQDWKLQYNYEIYYLNQAPYSLLL